MHITGIFSRIILKNSLEYIKTLQEFGLFPYSIQDSIIKKELMFHLELNCIQPSLIFIKISSKNRTLFLTIFLSVGLNKIGSARMI